MPNRSIMCMLMFSLMVAASLVIPATLLSQENDQKTEGAQQSSLQQRIDFGNAYIMGQSIKSGAVYLLHRKKSDIDSMLKLRKHYRDEIMEEYGIENTALAAEKKDAATDTK